MGRTSTKENKNSYQLAREELGLTREKASELLETIAPERIEKIENERTVPRPDEVLTMAEKYKRPALCNYYCSRQCPIGREYVPQVSVRELSAIVLEMLASLNAMDKKKERLIEITADGQISSDEIDDFIRIRQELERISVTVETLQLWTERMLANGQIDAEAYKAKLGERVFFRLRKIKAGILRFLPCCCNTRRGRIVVQGEGTTPRYTKGREYKCLHWLCFWFLVGCFSRAWGWHSA